MAMTPGDQIMRKGSGAASRTNRVLYRDAASVAAAEASGARCGALAPNLSDVGERPYFFSGSGPCPGLLNVNELNIDLAWFCICSCICTNMFFDCSI